MISLLNNLTPDSVFFDNNGNRLNLPTCVTFILYEISRLFLKEIII